jgi:uncharacterized membrane protein
MRVNIAHWIIIFILYSYWGWLIDTLVLSVKYRKLTNSGFLLCPVMPFYGISALPAIILLTYLDNPYFIFIACLPLCCLSQYITGFIMEAVFGIRFNDYSHHKLTVQGRINFIGVAVQAVIMTVVLVFIHNPVAELIVHIPTAAAVAAAVIAVLVVGTDALLTVRNIVRLNGLLAACGKNRLYGSAIQARLRRDSIHNIRLFKAFPYIKHFHYP